MFEETWQWQGIQDSVSSLNPIFMPGLCDMVPWTLTAGRGSIGSVELKTEGRSTKGSPSMYISPGRATPAGWMLCKTSPQIPCRCPHYFCLGREDPSLLCLEQLEQVSKEAADKLQWIPVSLATRSILALLSAPGSSASHVTAVCTMYIAIASVAKKRAQEELRSCATEGGWWPVCCQWAGRRCHHDQGVVGIQGNQSTQGRGPGHDNPLIRAHEELQPICSCHMSNVLQILYLPKI